MTIIMIHLVWSNLQLKLGFGTWCLLISFLNTFLNLILFRIDCLVQLLWLMVWLNYLFHSELANSAYPTKHFIWQRHFIPNVPSSNAVQQYKSSRPQWKKNLKKYFKKQQKSNTNFYYFKLMVLFINNRFLIHVFVY